MVRVAKRSPWGRLSEVRCRTIAAGRKAKSALNGLAKRVKRAREWKSGVKKIQAKFKMSKAQVLQRTWEGRWAGMALTRSRKRVSLAKGGRVHVVVSPLHAGDSLCPQGNLCTTALCHTKARQCARAGDAILELSLAGGGGKGLRRARGKPAVYRKACSAMPTGARALLSISGVSFTVPAASYQSQKGLPQQRGLKRYRRDQIYTKAVGSCKKVWRIEGERWTLKTRIRKPVAHLYGARDFSQPVVVGRTWLQLPNSLAKSPRLPASMHRSIFGKGWPGRGAKIAQGPLASRLVRWAQAKP